MSQLGDKKLKVSLNRTGLGGISDYICAIEVLSSGGLFENEWIPMKTFNTLEELPPKYQYLIDDSHRKWVEDFNSWMSYQRLFRENEEKAMSEISIETAMKAFVNITLLQK